MRKSEVARLKQKTPVPPNLTRSEKRAAETDTWVKGHIAQCREEDKIKTSRLKALREAQEAERSPTEAVADSVERTTSRPAKRAQRIWVPGPATRNDGKPSNS